MGPSQGGIRRHVRYLASHPPAGFETAGIWGPEELREFFAGSEFYVTRSRSAPPQADVVHAHGLAAGRIALRRRRPPVVLTVHTDLRTQGRTSRSRALRAVARMLVSRADALIAVSKCVAASIGGRRVHVIAPASEPLSPPTLSRDEVRHALGCPPDRVVVITVARLHRDKNLELFVQAVRSTGADGWICGEGPEHARLAELAEGTRVRLLGFRDDVTDLLAAADVFALPSVGEAYGIAVLEAVQAGLPAAISDAGSMREIVGDAGLVVPVGDQRAFVDAVARLVGDAGLRAELGARARAAEVPRPSDLVARIGEVYELVCR